MIDHNEAAADHPLRAIFAPACIRNHDVKGATGVTARQEAGVLCFPCYARTRYNVRMLAEEVSHVAAQKFPSIVSPPSERVGGSKDPRIPWQHEASEALDEMWAVLGNWTTYFSDRLHIRPPSILWQVVKDDVSIEKVPAHWSIEKLEAVIAETSQWLLTNSRAWVGHARVGDFHDETGEVLRRIRGRWPLSDPPPRRASRPCLFDGVGCGVGHVVVSYQEGEPIAICNACGWRPDSAAEYAIDDNERTTS